MLKARAGYVARARLHVWRHSGAPEGRTRNLEIPDRRFRVVRNDCREWEAYLCCAATRPAFTTLLTGNGVSAAFSVKVRHT
jgi:hypothetical protein